MHDSLLKTLSETESSSEGRGRNRPTCRVVISTCGDGNQVQFQTKRRQKKNIRSLQLDSES